MKVYKYRIWREDGSIITDDGIYTSEVKEGTFNNIKSSIWTMRAKYDGKEYIIILSKEPRCLIDYICGIKMGLDVVQNFDKYFTS